ncbi:Hpt domain-containing protein [Pseudoduganella namucuonensis]|uniref:Hpt domain-containing protein n=1 Tax=Pseudoduganella namucuonensis TaxID=1035707 RepID=A0A1I7M0R5_9BURK|nr:Hpt domain-containing protein [Pseudoduganella namucuonensis]SFV15515.1 Hpt domain-containing protein [Pseudoduganella namucuonensis]
MTAPADLGAPASQQHILDTVEGLDRLMGDHALYRQLLRRFRNDHQHAMDEVRQSLARGDREAALCRLHGLKGAAAMVGGREVREFASGAEACLDGDALALLDGAMAALLAAADAYLREVDGAGTAAAPPRAEEPATRELLARLAELLDEGDGEAIDVLERSATALAACLGVDRFQEVASAAHQYDFESALAALRPALA